VPFGEVEVFFELVEDGAAAGVDAEVFAGELEVGDVGFQFKLEELARDEVGEEEELLGEGEDERAERGDVGLERVARHAHEVLGQRHAHVPAPVLLLHHARVALVVRALVRAHRVHQLVLRPPPLPPPVRQHHRRPAHPKYTILQQHRPLVAKIPVQRYVLRAHHHRIRIPVHLHQNQNRSSYRTHIPSQVSSGYNIGIIVVTPGMT
jgi:hypothetical protein